jgi:hypothetical protein
MVVFVQTFGVRPSSCGCERLAILVLDAVKYVKDPITVARAVIVSAFFTLSGWLVKAINYATYAILSLLSGPFIYLFFSGHVIVINCENHLIIVVYSKGGNCIDNQPY